jgi:hypothetical protein
MVHMMMSQLWRHFVVLGLSIAAYKINVISAFTSKVLIDRKTAIAEILSSFLIHSSTAERALALAPFAPVNTLIPEARVKVSIDRAVASASNLII